MLSFSPRDRPSIDQIMNHRWLKTTSTSSSSSSSRTKHPPQTSSSASDTSRQSFSSSLCSSSSGYSYHKSPYYQSPKTPAVPDHRAAASAHQSNHSSSRPASGNRTPAASPRPVPATAFHSPVQTRSQSRCLGQSSPRERPSYVSGGDHRGEDYRYENIGSSAWVGGYVPRTPHLQTRKHYHHQVSPQVTRKK